MSESLTTLNTEYYDRIQPDDDEELIINEKLLNNDESYSLGNQQIINEINEKFDDFQTRLRAYQKAANKNQDEVKAFREGLQNNEKAKGRTKHLRMLEMEVEKEITILKEKLHQSYQLRKLQKKEVRKPFSIEEKVKE